MTFVVGACLCECNYMHVDAIRCADVCECHPRVFFSGNEVS